MVNEGKVTTASYTTSQPHQQTTARIETHGATKSMKELFCGLVTLQDLLRRDSPCFANLCTVECRIIAPRNGAARILRLKVPS
jgi:hypothetical protein